MTSWVAFAIFIIVLIKDILVSDFKVLPVRSLLNRQISWFLILPLSLVGVVLASREIRRTYLGSEKKVYGDTFKPSLIHSYFAIHSFSLAVLLIH